MSVLIPTMIGKHHLKLDMPGEFSNKVLQKCLTTTMYVLTNPDQRLGSGLIVHDKVLRHILDTIGEDIYVLPSSIHELIVIPSSVVDDENYLTKMVHEINQNEVEPKDRLSDDVYRVDYTTMKFRTIQYQE